MPNQLPIMLNSTKERTARASALRTDKSGVIAGLLVTSPNPWIRTQGPVLDHLRYHPIIEKGFDLITQLFDAFPDLV